MNESTVRKPAPTLPEDNATLARRLIADAGYASLGTRLASSDSEQAGWPYTSLVQVASDAAGNPILLISDLAAHSANIAGNPQVSLLFDGTAGYEDPLAGPRLTLLGEAATTTDPAIRERFLQRHPKSSLYAGFKDFRFYRVTMLRAHLVAGFGRIVWIEGEQLRSDAR
ncbi:MAG: pyridoxamine 5'-phosphate oxidase family protein [Rhodospirillaceae bacterium]|nr:pyridoxamine 5'-phosphate oxidase family protein [Rhodospirillaceae bacterium]